MATNVLVLCTHNSARSVLAEGMLNHWAARLGKPVRAYSAGSAPAGEVHWGYSDPSNAEGKRRAFELTRQAIGYRMLQLLALPLDRMDRAALQRALVAIGET